MTITRLLLLVAGGLVLLRLCMPLLTPFIPRLRRAAQRLQVVIDVAGGLVMLFLAASVWWRGRGDVALVLLLFGLPVFIGMWRALPAWWRGNG